MLYLTRVKKFGMSHHHGLLVGIIMFVTGMGYFSIVTGLVCGLIADSSCALGATPTRR